MSIINWELWQKVNGTKTKIKTEYDMVMKNKKVKEKPSLDQLMRDAHNQKIEVCVGIGTDQLTPEYVTVENIELKEIQEELLAEIMKRDQELGLYDTTMSTDEAKDRLIEVLLTQVVDLSMMSKIELGDDVIAEINRLKKIINE